MKDPASGGIAKLRRRGGEFQQVGREFPASDQGGWACCELGDELPVEAHATQHCSMPDFVGTEDAMPEGRGMEHEDDGSECI